MSADGTPVDVAEPDVGILRTWRESPVPVKAMLVGTLVNRLGGFLQVFLVLFLTHLGFTAVQAGFALGAYGAGSVVGVLLGGSINDRIGPRWTIAAGMLAGAGFLLAILYVQSYPAIVVVVLVGSVTQFYRPASAALLAELTRPDRQVMIFAMSRLALNLGTTAAPLVGAALVTVSYDLLFWGEAGAALAMALLTLLLVPNRLRPGSSPVASQGAPADLPVDAPTPGPPEAARTRTGYLALLGDRRFLLYLVAVTVNSAVYIQYVSILPIAMRDEGLLPIWYSVMVALNGVVVILFELPMTKVVSRLPARRVLAIGFSLLGAGVACYALPWGVAVFVLGTLLWSLAEIIEVPTMFAYLAQAGPARLQGRYIAAGHGLFSIGAAVGPVIGLALWSAIGRGVWPIYALASLLALLPGWYGIRPERARAA